MNKILFLDVDVDDFGEYFRNKRNATPGVDSLKMYRNIPDFLRIILLFLGLKVNKHFLWLIYGKWKHKIDSYEYIVFPSRKSSLYAIEKFSKKKKVFVYYWNLVTDKEINPEKLKGKRNIFLSTFDPSDAQKYGIRFVDTYLFDLKLPEEACIFDAFYCGIIRPNRIEILEQLEKHFKNMGMKCDFNIMQFDNKKMRMTYDEVLSRSNKSRAIIDLTRENQSGLTLRPLEALILKKKLITNNQNIKNYDFYNSKNIFILGEDNIENLYHFITEPYSEINMEIVENYYFENWLRKVLNYDQR